MIDFPISGPVELDQWVHTEKDSSFGEFSLKLAKKLVKRKYIVIAVDKGLHEKGIGPIQKRVLFMMVRK